LLGFAILFGAIVATGVVVARLLYRLFEEETPAGIEVAVAGALIGLSLWLGVNWLLAISLSLTRRNLLMASVGFVIAGCTTLRWPRRFRLAPWTVIAGVAIILWSGFILWRGSIVPPASDDVLAYHLPKAVMIMRAHGHERFDWPDQRLRIFPSNYELLLADVLILSGNDRLTEWIGTASYVGLLAMVALYARRWWGPGLHVTASVLAVAGAPLLLLHSGHDKNDLLTGVLAAGALFWSARWCARGGVVPATLAVLGGVTAVGTKMTAGAVVLGIAPFGIAALIRRPPRFRVLLVSVILASLAFLLCGGWVFVQNAEGGSGDLSYRTGVPTAAYGEWRNLIDVPYLLVRVSLGFDAEIPWRHERWSWFPYNLYGSHFGPLLGAAFLSLGFCVWRYRSKGVTGARRERAIVTGAALLAFAILLPLVQTPPSAAQATLRYVIFILPVVVAWTLAPLIRSLVAHRPGWMPHVALTAILMIFMQEAVQTAMFDTFTPIEQVRWCLDHPDTRRIFWMPNRAESVVDEIAGPHDKIAIHGGEDLWVYPAYGRDLTRTVVYVTALDRIPIDAQWVAIDYLPAQDNKPMGPELQLYERMRVDARFRLVYRNERLNQAVFRRL
jgi:hypothetical protein